MAVHLRAKWKGLRGLEKSECPDVKKALKERGHLILPFVLVIYMICAGYKPVRQESCRPQGSCRKKLLYRASYNIVTVEGAAASRVFFHLKAEAVRMGEKMV